MSGLQKQTRLGSFAKSRSGVSHWGGIESGCSWRNDQDASIEPVVASATSVALRPLRCVSLYCVRCVGWKPLFGRPMYSVLCGPSSSFDTVRTYSVGYIRVYWIVAADECRMWKRKAIMKPPPSPRASWRHRRLVGKPPVSRLCRGFPSGAICEKLLNVLELKLKWVTNALPVMHFNAFSSRHSVFISGNGVVGGRKLQFQQTIANFQQKRLWMLKSLILVLNFSKVGISDLKFCILKDTFSNGTKLSYRLHFSGGAVAVPVPLHSVVDFRILCLCLRYFLSATHCVLKFSV